MRAKLPSLLILALVVSSIGAPVAAQPSIPMSGSASLAQVAPSNDGASASAAVPAVSALDVKAASTPPLKSTDGVPAAVQRLIDAGNGSLLISTSRATGYARFVRMATGSTSTLTALLGLGEAAEAQSQAAAFLAQYGDAFGLTEGGASLELKAIETDYLGATHLVYRQLYKGVPVFAGLMRFHFNRTGQLTAVNGVVVPDIALNAAPALTADAAADIASARVAELSAGRISAPLARLNIAKNNLFVYRLGLAQGVAGASHLVYEVEINNRANVREFVYVDAHSGKVVDQISAIQDGLSRNVYSGTYTTTALVWQEGDAFPYTGVFSEDINSIILGTGDSYNIFATVGNGRDSYDGAGHVMEIVNNDPTISCPNANWNGTTTNYCNGVTSDDVVAHEWGHAYTEYTDNLIYAWQPGALNESYSDIWGESVDLINGRQTDNPNTTRSAGACTNYTPFPALLRVSSPVSITGDYEAQAAAFGPALTVPGITGTVVLGEDATGSTTPGDPNPSIYDACEPLTNGGAVSGNVALVYRGTCNFTVKVKNAQDAGAIGVIVANRNNASGLPGMGGADATIVIPSLGISFADGETIRVELPNTVTGTLTLDTGAVPPEDTYRWLMGEDSTAFGGAIRDMWTPGCYGDPGEVIETNYHCDASDGGGVHSNSGVPNHAYALLVDGGVHNGITVTALGMTKTLAIYWRAQSVYQTPTTDFADHADALETSCSDLIGLPIFEPSTSISTPVTSTVTISAGDCTEVGDAMDAVEMRQDPGAQCNFQPLLDPNAPALCSSGTGTPVTVFSDTLEVAPTGWTISHTDVYSATAFDWIWDNSLPGGQSGSAFYGPDPVDDGGNCSGSTGDVSRVMYLASPVINLPVTTTVTRLAFDHYVATELGWDGGNVKISVNGGPYTLVAAADFTFNPYNANLNSAGAGNTNPLAGQAGFTGADEGSVVSSWGQSQVNLSGYADPGDSIQLRFELGTDGCSGNDGWYVDNVHVYSCSADTNPTIDVSPSPLTSAQLTDVVMTQTLTINNTGDVGSLDWAITESALAVRSQSQIIAAQRTAPQAGMTLSARPSGTIILGDMVRPLAPSAVFTLTQSVSDTVQAGSVSCNAGGLHTNNAYLRVFDLSGLGMTDPLGVSSVTFGIETANDGGGAGQPVEVNLYSLSGSLAYANMTLVGSASITVSDQSLTLLNVPVTGTVAPNNDLVVEIFTPNGQSASHSFFIGSNSLGQTAPSYIAAADCGFSDPINLANIGFGNMHLVMTVYGDPAPLCTATDLPWLTLTPSSGATLAGASSAISAVFDSTGLTPGSYTGNLCVTSNDAANPVVNVPVSLTVTDLLEVYLPVITR